MGAGLCWTLWMLGSWMPRLWMLPWISQARLLPDGPLPRLPLAKCTGSLEIHPFPLVSRSQVLFSTDFPPHVMLQFHSPLPALPFLSPFLTVVASSVARLLWQAYQGSHMGAGTTKGITQWALRVLSSVEKRISTVELAADKGRLIRLGNTCAAYLAAGLRHFALLYLQDRYGTPVLLGFC